MGAVVQLKAVFTQRQTFDQHLQPTIALHHAAGFDLGIVQPQLQVIELGINQINITFDGNQNVVTGDLIDRAGKHAKGQVRAICIIGIGAAAAAQATRQGQRQQTE